MNRSLSSRVAHRCVQFGICALSPLCIAVTVVRAQVPGELRGRVTDAQTAQPVAEARVEVVGRTDAVRTDVNGGYSLRGLEPRPYTIRVRAFGYVVQQLDVQITNGRSTVRDVVLEVIPATLSAVVVQERQSADTRASGTTTFDRAEIEASGRRDVGELLGAVPSLVVTRRGGAGASTQVSMRGSSANEVLVLLDGTPVNSVIGGDADLSTIDLESVERVTVRPGPQSSRYGGRALAGVIEIESRRPRRETSMLARTGGWGERTVSLSAGESVPLGGMRVGAALTGDYRSVRGDFPYEVPDVRGGGTTHRSNNDMLSRQLLAVATVDGAQWSVGMRGSRQTLGRGVAGSVVQPSMTGRADQTRADGGVDAHGRRGALSWTVNADLADERAISRDTAPPFGVRYVDTVRATSVTSAASATLERKLFTASLGGEARSLDVRATQLNADAPHWQRVLGTWATVRGHRAFGGVQLDGEAGGRVDENSLIGGTVASPRLSVGAGYGALTSSLAIADGYAPPTLADEFFHEGVLVRPNPNLQPERTRRALDARLAWRETAVGPLTLSAEAAAYRADVDGMILWFPDFRFIWSPSNFDVDRAGWELSGRVGVPRVGASVEGNFNRTDVTYSGGVLTGQVAYRPRTTGHLSIGLAPPRGWARGLRIEMEKQYVGERRTVPGSPLNVLDPYWLTDLRLAKSIAPAAYAADVTLGIDNLADRHVAMLVDYPFPGRTWSLGVRLRRGSTGTVAEDRAGRQ